MVQRRKEADDAGAAATRAATALRAAIDFAQPHAQRAPLVREAIAVASARLAIEEEAGRREAEARLTLTLTPTLR